MYCERFVKFQFARDLDANGAWMQHQRYRGKINIRKPKIYYKKAVLNQLLTPFYVDPNKGKTLEELCSNRNVVESEQQLSPYDRILSREVRNWFENSKMVGLLHVNSIGELEKFDTRVLLHRANMHYKYYGPHIIRDAIKNSSIENLEAVVSKYTAYVFSPEINVTTLKSIMKKCKKMCLIAGILEGQLLKLDEFLRYGEMDITTAQSCLVQVLQSAGGLTLNQQLTHHQSTLVTRLKQIGTNETSSDNKQ